MRIAASAHGLALFLQQRLLPPGRDALANAEAQAARTARAIADQQRRVTPNSFPTRP